MSEISVPGLDWLAERPIAHRGLHDAAAGAIENSETAIRAAIDAGYAIEVDVQQTADDDAVVFHDFTLNRLTDETGTVIDRDRATLEKIRLKDSTDSIMSLSTLLDIVDGQVPLIIEMKSAETGDMTLAHVVAQAAESYDGPLAAMSFDPLLVDALRKARPYFPRGFISSAYRSEIAAILPFFTRLKRRYLLDITTCSPHFIAYDSRALPSAAPWIARRVFNLPVLTWTVSSAAEQARIAPYVDQIIFENFRPQTH